jgi:hypothetical protein
MYAAKDQADLAFLAQITPISGVHELPELEILDLWCKKLN